MFKLLKMNSLAGIIQINTIRCYSYNLPGKPGDEVSELTEQIHIHDTGAAGGKDRRLERMRQRQPGGREHPGRCYTCYTHCHT